MINTKFLDYCNPEVGIAVKTFLYVKKDGSFSYYNMSSDATNRVRSISNPNPNAHQRVDKHKKRRCESCGIHGKTDWAHIKSTSQTVIELCRPCHFIYDMIDKVG